MFHTDMLLFEEERKEVSLFLDLRSLWTFDKNFLEVFMMSHVKGSTSMCGQSGLDDFNSTSLDFSI